MAVAVLVAAGGGDSGDAGDTAVTTARSPQSRLIGFLRRKTMLLLLDNLEQVDGAADLISLLLAECPGLCVLATSRGRNFIPACRTALQSSAPRPRCRARNSLSSVRRWVAADFHLTPHNRPILEAILPAKGWIVCRSPSNCAAQIDLLSPAQLLAHLRTHPLDLLVDRAHDLPPRQRTNLRSAVLHSYVLLQKSNGSCATWASLRTVLPWRK